MKGLDKFSLDIGKCKRELARFKRLLDSKPALSETSDVLPFFKSNRNLAALVGGYNPKINGFDRLAHEFNLFGDYACDLVVGDSRSRNFCFVEFEDGSPGSIFTTRRGKATSEWSARFDHGFGQLLDWFKILDDQKGTSQFKAKFGSDAIQYVGLLVIGRRHYLTDTEYERLLWRSDQVQVGAKQVHCITFDELYQTLDLKLRIFG